MSEDEMQERALRFARAHVKRHRRSKNLLRDLKAWARIVHMLYAGTPEIDLEAVAQRAAVEAAQRSRKRRTHVAQPAESQLLPV